MDTVTIPQYVDELPQIWFWEADEAIFIVLGLFIGIIVGWMFTCAVVGVLMASVFGRFKQGQNRGLIIHVVYWYGVIPLKGLWCEISFQKHWTS